MSYAGCPASVVLFRLSCPSCPSISCTKHSRSCEARECNIFHVLTSVAVGNVGVIEDILDDEGPVVDDIHGDVVLASLATISQS